MKLIHVQYAILGALVLACATTTIKEVPVTHVELPEIEVSEPAKTPGPIFTVAPRRVPHFLVLKGAMPEDYRKAIALIEAHANTDKFAAYVIAKKTVLSHTDKTLPEAMKMFREQMDKQDIVEVTFYKNIFSSSIGGWDGTKILQNLKFVKDPEGRAGHLLHEVSHKYGWKHQGNYHDRYNNVNSFPYVIGYAFEDYLRSLKASKLAGE